MDMESCSWCATEVEYKTLTGQVDGAMICQDCQTEENDNS